MSDSGMENTSKITPTGHHTLVLPDVIDEKSAGGIILAPQSRELEQRASTKGILVAVGASAWYDFAEGKPWAKVGDRVSYAKFAGIEMEGADKKKYMLLNDQDILAVFDQ